VSLLERWSGSKCVYTDTVDCAQPGGRVKVHGDTFIRIDDSSYDGRMLHQFIRHNNNLLRTQLTPNLISTDGIVAAAASSDSCYDNCTVHWP